MEHLSENTVKKAALSFLKAYYKFRPRIGKTISSFDLETNDGIVVDGSLSFQKEDGSTFLSTFEATSLAKKGEVIYKIQSKILLWDSLAISFMLTSIVMSYGFYFDHFTIKQIGWLGSLSLMTGVFGLTFLAYQYLFQWLKRYRYIYAVEQFKRYHADEQWIAIADDVFKEPTDAYLKELKDQCVINGFGLILVDENLDAQLLITPSRIEVFGDKRGAMSFGRDAARRRSKLERFKLSLNKSFSKLSTSSTRSLLRYQRSYLNQIALSLAAIFIIGVILFKESQDKEMVYVDENKYEKELTEIAEKTVPETKDYLVDSAYVESAKGKTKPYILVSEDDPEDEFTEKGSSVEFSNQPTIEILITTLDGEIVAYDCERFFNYTGTKYVIQEGVYGTISEAQEKMENLNTKGINANCMWTGCFTEELSAYIVFIDLLFDHSDEAELISKSFKRKFNFKSNQLRVRPISILKP